MVTLLLMWSCHDSRDKNKLIYPVWAFPTFAHFDFAKGNNGNLFVPPLLMTTFWVEKGTVAELQQEMAIRVICRNHLPAPVMLAPLKEVFPVTSAPSKLAFDKFVCKWSEAKPIMSVLKNKSPCWYLWTDSSIRQGKHEGICFIENKQREEHERNGPKYKRLI